MSKTQKKRKEQELNPYQIDKFGGIPALPKVLFAKWWFSAAACYFVLFGIMILQIGALETALIMGIVMGIINEYFIKNMLKFMSTPKTDLTKHIEVERGFTKGLLLNILFGVTISVVIAYSYNLANMAIINIFNEDPSKVPFAVEPFSYGLIYLAYDYIFLGVKNKFFRK